MTEPGIRKEISTFFSFEESARCVLTPVLMKIQAIFPYLLQAETKKSVLNDIDPAVLPR